MSGQAAVLPLPRLQQLWRTVPRGVRIGVAVVTLLLGIVVLTRPSTSLAVLAILIGSGAVLSGVLELADAGGRTRAQAPVNRLAIVLAVLWIVVGIVIWVLPGLTVRLLVVFVAVGLLGSGLVSLARSVHRGRVLADRVADAAFGAASVVFAVLAVLWPDITLLVVSVLFGARLMIAAVTILRREVRRAPGDRPRHPAGPLRRWATASIAVLTVLASMGAAAISYAVRAASPVTDEFYAAPREVPAEPGRLLRAGPFTRGVPDGATAWRILYTTTAGDGSPTTASGLVVVPSTGAGEWPVIDWNHGTTGYAQNCAPSLAEEPFTSGALFLLPDVIEEGWALVATDYIGLGTPGSHPYLIGADSAHASLDAVRAARELTEADLGANTVVWGHSQGGGAALWTAAVAEAYAPDVPLSGTVAMAPAANLPALVEHLPEVTGGSIFASFAFSAYAQAYPDVTWRQYIRPGAEATVRAMSTRCLAEPGALVSVLDVLGMSRDPAIFRAEKPTGSFAQRLEENVPPATVRTPLLIAQGEADGLVVPDAQQSYVDGACAAGESIDYRIFAGRDHIPLVSVDSPLVPQLLTWTQERFSGDPVPAGCRSSAY
ncbi:MAG: DUF308 domain-containing protein [Microbacterium sp.]|nr:DUF308 domain-containing protein [Microbacterium sp.]